MMDKGKTAAMTVVALSLALLGSLLAAQARHRNFGESIKMPG